MGKIGCDAIHAPHTNNVRANMYNHALTAYVWHCVRLDAFAGQKQNKKIYT